MEKYKAREGSRLSNGDAEVLGEFLEIEFPDGGITADAVVGKASDPTSKIHHLFEWDDKKAAHEYRLTQARVYIHSIIISDEENDDVRAFHHVMVGQGSYEYVPLDKAINSPNLWEQVVESALQEVRGWSRRYKQYQQLSLIHEAIDVTYKKHTTRRENENQRAAR